MTASLTLQGHACFALTLPSGRRLVIDPYEADSFGGRIALAPLPDHFDLAISTHLHHDHAAFASVPSAQVVAAPFEAHDVSVAALTASHDEFGGRLRGGMVQLLAVTIAGTRVLFTGDLGERPVGALLDQMLRLAPDVLIVPVGGFYTLDADGAAELTALLRPRVVVPCHAREHGGRFEELGSGELFGMRFAHHRVQDELLLPLPDVLPAEPTCVVALRPRALRGVSGSSSPATG